MTATKPEKGERAAVTQPKLGPLGYLRFGWRQLTSMRTALFLLLLVAVAAVPGSVFPQRSLDPARTADWIAQHPDAGPILDRLGAFEVYSTPWFSAIYLLLFISLIGCIIPRTSQHWKVLRSKPPRAPKRLARLNEHLAFELEATPEEALDQARQALRGRRMRVTSHDETTVSAEGGYLKEVGNLAFHIALVTLIVGFAIGHLYGWKADILVPRGDSFVSTATRYDTFAPGPLVDESSLSPFVVRVDEMKARFEDSDVQLAQRGQPRAFRAEVTYQDEPGGPEQHAEVAVNHPLEMDGATIFLLGNGYAPVVTVKDAKGEVLYTGATPFLAQDGSYRSVGAIKVGAAQPQQLGFVGLFLPTSYIDPELGPVSVFPDVRNPALALSLYEGDLFPGGRPQSVFALDTKTMKKVETADGSDAVRLWLQPGETETLPGGRGTITFDGIERFAGFSVRYDPGKWLVLGSSLVALAGLIASLTIKRRRVFVRVRDGSGPGLVAVEIGALTRDDDDGLGRIVARLGESMGGPSADDDA
ncbi:cytochrome c biogenesis protein ResB [Janibacter sp. GXQ6167]|uniref:cytochrome c biogenesis protein ResB n=1 Tax=Janibacter sp. GXQ6167 TaxID=3240791 RepID=UPI003523AACC